MKRIALVARTITANAVRSKPVMNETQLIHSAVVDNPGEGPSSVKSEPCRHAHFASAFAEEIRMPPDHKKSSTTGKIVPITLYTLICAGIGYLAFTLIDRHVSAHRVPGAFGYEYLVLLLPFLAAFISFPFLPLIVCTMSRLLFRMNQLRFRSPVVLALSTGAYGILLLVTGFFFTWARQQ